MDIRHLRQILAIRDCGSFARAAEALHMAQPALSKSMARLEAELGLTIFTRTSTGSELTPMGELIAERAERVMAATRNLARDAALIAGGDAGAIRLGFGTLLKDTLLPRLLLKIVEAHPQLRLEIEFGTADRLLTLVESRELDLVVCRPPATPTALTYVEALRAELIFVGAPTHPLASERGISTDRLAEFPCAGPNSAGLTVSAFLGQPAASETLDAYTANDYEALMPLVLAGRTTLLAPSFFVQQELAAGRLARLDVDWAGETSFGCYTTQASSFSPILAEITRDAVELGRAIQQEWRGLCG